jgi:GDP-6-deoxy-D-talose 4-dehydrogenase
MRIFVTGAQGFTGRHFVNIARSFGHTVITLQSNLENKHGLKNELAKSNADAVVHLAGLAFVGHEDLAAFYAVNVVGTTNLLDALLTLVKSPKIILLVSSANVYGNSETSPIKESQIPKPVNHYAMSKLAMENMASTYFDRLPIIIARPFNYTGIGQEETFLIPKLVSHFTRKAKVIELGNLKVEREFNDVRMVCKAYLDLLVNGINCEIYNICSGRPVKLQNAIDILEKLTAHKLEVIVNPDLIRTSEVNTLCGCSKKLENSIGELQHYGLESTLKWMISGI